MVYGIVVGTAMVFLMIANSHLNLIKYTQIQFGYAIFWAQFAAIIVAGFIFYFFDIAQLPRSVSVLYTVVSTCLIYYSRKLLQAWFFEVQLSLPFQKNNQIQSIIIYGAGEAGLQSHRLLQNYSQYRVVAFVDDDREKVGHFINLVRICSSDKLPQLIQRYHVSLVLLAIPSLNIAERKPIYDKLSKFQVAIKTLPTLDALNSNTIDYQHIRNLDIIELLGRQSVDADTEALTASVQGKTVLVSGGGGSVGSEICKQLLSNGVKKVVIFEHSEYNLYQIEQKLQKINQYHPSKVVLCLASVTSLQEVRQVFAQHQFDCVYHCAAYKHVPMIEANPLAGFYNNAYGTLIVALVAMQFKVANFILISSDKAVRPTNLMGASKRLSELLIYGLRSFTKLPSSPLIDTSFVNMTNTNTIFTAVRFGNVLNSSGSVIPLFRKQLLQGGPLTVTHPEVTRFFMTIEEAAQLVLQTVHLSKSGWLFLLDMGQSIKIDTLAQDMIKLAGLTVKDSSNPNGQIAIKYTGLRPGEKLYEELLINDSAEQSKLNKISICHDNGVPITEAIELLEQILNCCNQSNFARSELLSILKNNSIDYHVVANSQFSEPTTKNDAQNL